MRKKGLLPYGFKTRAEKLALNYRKDLQLMPKDPLCGFKLAEHLNIEVYTAPNFIKDTALLKNILGTTKKDSGWSALTMLTEKGNKIIIHNHLHAPPRQQSNLMHELAHIICEHRPIESKSNDHLSLLMRQYNPQHEEEAAYLGSALQIPREGLLWALKEKMKKSDIAMHFKASEQMVTFRINSTGVRKQLGFIS
jgi:Zn-dependent peptidase ImmA (M78 family)